NLFCIGIAQDFISTNTDTLNRFIKFDPTRDAEKDIAAAIAEAKKSNKRILLDVGGEWCGWCKKLDKFFQENKDVFDYLHQNYVLVKVNYSKENKNEKVLSKYPKIKGYPHFFVLNKNGKLIHSQDTDELESGNGYDKEKIFKFLKKWSNKK
ncbi:MAG: thioredoxin family protein, partial [Ignavibacteria bacterium]|nr:thioredoxin family protein [Ignavibacteria bacterium]